MLFEIEISPAEHKQKFKKFAFYYRNYYEMPFEKKGYLKMHITKINMYG
jgi:hypothetical protein